MANIVISYRREDSKWITGRIFDRLESHYGPGQVFMDIDNIPLGTDFREHLRRTLDRCDILLAVIGPNWIGLTDSDTPRLNEATDWVRIEIATAIAKKIPVIPLLIDGTRMPKPADLPDDLGDFAFHQATTIDTGVDFRSHMLRLTNTMDRLLAGKPVAAASPAAVPVPNADPEPLSAPTLEERGERTDETASTLRNHRRSRLLNNADETSTAQNPAETGAVKPASPPVVTPTLPKSFLLGMAFLSVVAGISWWALRPQSGEPNMDNVVGTWCKVVQGTTFRPISIEKLKDGSYAAFYDNMRTVKRQGQTEFIRDGNAAYRASFMPTGPDQLTGTTTTPFGTESYTYARCKP